MPNLLKILIYSIIVSLLSPLLIFGQQTPYHGTPFSIPGTIQLEDFDNGGEGVAYHDTTSGNTFGANYRPGEDVDIDNDTGGGYLIAGNPQGEWLEYTVDVSETGTYTIEVLVGATGLGGTFHIEFDGVDKTGTMQVPNTGSGGCWNMQAISKIGVDLTQGQQIMKLVIDSNHSQWDDYCGCMNYINIISEGPNNPPGAPTGLLCEGQVNPVNVEDFTPDLSWTFNDPDPGNSQASYQILVADSLLNITANNGNMLDTGKLDLSDTSMIYNGTQLQTSTKYYWKVKTWDNADAAGPYSSVAEFTMSDTVPVLENYTNPYGVNNWWWSSSICQDFVDANLKYFRVLVDWNSYEGSRDNYSLSNINGPLDIANNVGAEISLCIIGSPRWSRSDRDKLLSCSATELAELATELLNYCENRRPGVVAAVEVFNEESTALWVDGISVSHGTDQRDPSWYYADLLKTVYQAVQTFNSTNGTDILTVMCGIWHASYHNLDELYQMGCKGQFDRINFHYYLIEQRNSDAGRPEEPWDTGTIWHFITNLKYLRYIADEWGDDSPIWLSEYGWRISDQTKQANYSEYIVDTCRKSGYVDLISIYVGADDWDQMAVIDTDPYNPKPLYDMYQNYGNQYPAWNPNDNEVLTPLTPASKDAYVVNPGFERGDTTGWHGAALDGSVKHSGSFSGKTNIGNSVRTDSFAVEPDRLYEVIAWLKVQSTNSDTSLILPNVIEGSSSWSPPNYYGIVDTRNYPNGWRRIRYMYLVPSYINEIAVEFWSDGSGTFWVDDLRVKALVFSSSAYGPIIFVSPGVLDFGEVRLNKSKTMTFNIINDGYGGTLAGTISSHSEWIEIQPASFSGNNVKVDVTVNNKILNQSSGTFTGTVIIQSNGGYAEVTVRLTATCVLPKPNPYDPTKGKLTFFGDGIVPNRTTIKIYTLSGELIRTLKNVGQGFNLANANLPTLLGQVPVCPTEITWDGKNEEGKQVINGIYIYTYESPKEKGIGKFTIIRK